MKVVNFAQRTPEWLAWRKTGATASAAAVLLNISPYKTYWRLWAEKTGRAIEEDLTNNPHVQRGIANEDKGRRVAERVIDDGFLLPVCAESTKHPFIKASLDGLTESNVPVEVKCPCEKQWNDVDDLGLDSEGYIMYSPQVQQQIYVTDADYGWLLFYNPADDGTYRLFKVLRDDKLIDEIVELSTQFISFVERDKEPLLDPERDVFIPKSDVASEWEIHATDYRQMNQLINGYKEKIAQLEEKCSESKNSMISIMGTFCRGDYAGVALTRYEKKGSIDYKNLIADLLPGVDEVVLEKYRKKPSIQSRVTVTDKMMPKNIVDIDVQAQLKHISDGKLTPALYF